MISRRFSIRQVLVVVALIVTCLYTYRSFTFNHAAQAQNPTAPVEKQADEIQHNQYDNIFAFGDSLSETLFDPEYDMPTAENPFGNIYPGRTSSGGPNWLGFLIHDHLNETLLYNLALGGAQISSAEFDDEKPGNRDFGSQVDTFLKKSGQNALPQWTPKRTLFAAWFGTNDVHGAFMRFRKYHHHDTMLENFFQQLDRLADNGAESFVVMTPEPLHLTRFHSFGEGPKNKDLRDALYDWNIKLKLYAKKWQKKTKNQVYIIDVTSMVEKALNEQVAKPCTADEDGGDPEECMWQDQFHLGIVPHRMIAQQVMDSISS